MYETQFDGRMRPGWRHIHHPIRTLSSGMHMLHDEWRRRALVYRGNRQFRKDPRYRLPSVTEGFASRIDRQGSDWALLERICKAYAMSIERQAVASVKYNPTVWWEQQRRFGLEPVINALKSHDCDALQRIYENFFRDDCSTGLIPVHRLKKDYFGQRITEFYARLFLIDALHRLDYWNEQTNGRYTLRDLEGPGIGNPFGVMLEGRLVTMGSEYQHYCARTVTAHLSPGRRAVTEIGGGYGGMAYYLTRDQPGITYIDFDMPESIALTSFFLLKAFPDLNAVLYGEAELDSRTISQADIILMPISELPNLPDCAVDLTFSSHTMSDLSAEALVEYCQEITRTTREHFVYVGSRSSAEIISCFESGGSTPLTLVNAREYAWNNHAARDADHVECLYRVQR
jgi:putative sugar O-methyltransferase